MQGVLLDPTTGKEAGHARVPASQEVEAWKRELAERDVRKQLQAASRHPGLKGTTTTNRYLSMPAAAAGISLATGGGAAWAFPASYTQIVAASVITSTFYIAAIVFQPGAASTTATTNELIIEVATGAAASEVNIIQIPFTIRNVTAAGYIPPAWIQLPEPKQVAANTRIAARVAWSVATTVQTLTGFKFVYEMV